jgi:hypothetical protein
MRFLRDKPKLKIFLWFCLFCGILVCAGSSIFYNTGISMLTTSFSNSKKDFSISGIMLGLLMIFSSATAICGISKESKKFFKATVVMNTLLLLGIISYMIFAIMFLKKYQVNINTLSDCSSFEEFSEIEQYANQAAGLFCSVECPCKIYNISLFPEEARIRMVTCNQTGVERVQDCKLFTEKLGRFSQFTSLMEAAESDDNCSGFCFFHPYHIFTNINSNIPEESCSENILDALKSTFLAMICSAAFIILLILIALLLSVALVRKRPEIEEVPLHQDMM